MKYVYLTALLLCTISCKESEKEAASSLPSSCRGSYAIKDANGIIRQRFDEHAVNTLGCVTDTVPLSVFEKQEAIRFDHNIRCSPQNIPSVTLISKNNYYWPRNDSIYLDLNAQTGQFRRLIIGKTASGAPLFQREVGCWYQRLDNVAESWGANVDFGNQILLDLEEASSSLEVHPMEVFRFDKLGTNWSMTRFDDNQDVDYTFCNPDGVPLEYCAENRNGNYMYYNPNLSAFTMAVLAAQALLIRSEFNFVEISNSVFEQKWLNTINTAKEFGTTEAIDKNYKFQFGISGLPDIPFYVDREIRSFLRGESHQMPQMSSSRLPPICYHGKRIVGSLEVWGEICYVGGTYTFTQQ